MTQGIYKHKSNQGFQKGHKIGVGNKNTTRDYWTNYFNK